MIVCDICGNKMGFINYAAIRYPKYPVSDKNYELCTECARKIEKYIKFEQVSYKKAAKK